MTLPRLLIIEDDPDLAATVVSALSANYEIKTASSGVVGVTMFEQETPDLLLLDLGLPELHGLGVLERVQVHAPASRVCIMTVFSDLETKLTAFAGGCDDYLVKPFSLDELEARVKALLRRSKSSPKRTLIWGDLCLYRGAPLVQRGNTRISLTPLEHRLLLYLADRPSQVVSRSELLDEVWQTADRYPNTVDVHIESLRKKIDVPFKTKSIRTAYRQGYYFEP